MSQSASALLGTAKPASGTPVSVGFISDGTATAFDFSGELRSAAATVDFLNKYRGGIAGRPIDLVTCQTHGDPSQAADCASQMIQKNVAAVALDVSTVAQNVWQPLHAAKIPVMFFQTAAGTTDPDSTFVLSDSVGPVAILPALVAKQAGGKNVTMVTVDTPQGREALGPLAEAVMKQAGLNLKIVWVPVGTPDMTSQMQAVAASNPNVVQVICAGDAFSISAFKGLEAAGYTGTVTTYQNCVDSTVVKALPAGALKGVTVGSASALDATTDPGYQLFEAVARTFGSNIDTTDATTFGSFIVLSALSTALKNMTGDITPATVTKALKSMQTTGLPGGGGMTFECDGKAAPGQPAVCVDQMLMTTIDGNGQPGPYKVIDINTARVG
jgi:branched-chain amino acid transport system substrate-binding protein